MRPIIGNRSSKYAVTQELHALIKLVAADFGRIRFMGKRQFQKFSVFELVTDYLFQFWQIIGHNVSQSGRRYDRRIQASLKEHS
jgi:hypothetical protein